jgi:hypothetical protein
VFTAAVSCRLENFVPDIHLESRLNADLIYRCKKTFEISGQTSSKLQLSVAQYLTNLGVSFVAEFIEPSTGYSIDLMVLNKTRESRLALEVDGPSHFFRLENGCWMPNGPTLWKRRLLASAGYQPVSLPFWEWRCCRNARERESYLKMLLDI